MNYVRFALCLPLIGYAESHKSSCISSINETNINYWIANVTAMGIVRRFEDVLKELAICTIQAVFYRRVFTARLWVFISKLVIIPQNIWIAASLFISLIIDADHFSPSFSGQSISLNTWSSAAYPLRMFSVNPSTKCTPTRNSTETFEFDEFR